METIKAKFGEMKEVANDLLKTATKGEKGHGPEDDLKKEPVTTEFRNDGIYLASPAESRLPDKMRAVVFSGKEKVEVKTIDLPKFKSPREEPLPHAIIVKVITSAICGSDLHMYRGRADFKEGLSFGHEVTGEVVEKGIDVRFLNVGDWVSIPFNVSCGRCRNCIDGAMQACLHVNPMAAQGAYGYSMSGGWLGGQADYLLVPFADYNCLRFPDKAKARQHMLDLAYLTDILPTGYHGCIQAGVSGGKMVFIAGAGPVGLCAAASAYLLGAALVVIADKNQERLEAAKQMGCLTMNVKDFNETTFNSKLKELCGYEYLDCAVECVGFEAGGVGSDSETNKPTAALDLCVLATKAGGCIGCPGVFLPADKGGPDAEAKMGHLRFKFGEMWTRGITLGTGQCPVNKYNYYLMQAILFGRLSVHKYLNTQVISLEQAPEAYKLFNEGKWVKYLIDPHNTLGMR